MTTSGGAPRDGGWTAAAPGARKLMLSALAVFAEKGFHGAATREIAAGASMSATAMYAHYRTKADLLGAISLAGHQDVHAACELVLDGRTAPRERMNALMHEFASWHARNHLLARVVQYELGALDPVQRAPVVELRRRTEQLFRAEVQSGVDVGDFACQDVEMAALALLSLGIDVSRWYRSGTDRTPGEIGAAYARLALAMLGGTAAAV